MTVDRLRTTPGDLLLGLGVTALVVSELNAATTSAPLVAGLVSVPVLLGLVWRRRAPVAVVLSVGLLNLYLSASAPGPFPPQLMFVAVLLAIYTAAACTTGRRALLAGGGSLLLVLAAHVVTGSGDAGDFLPELVWGAPWLAGRLVRRQTLRAGAAATQAADVLRRREEELREAREVERDRIARELHDVVAHAVSLMVVEAGAERLRLGDGAPQTSAVLDRVENTGRRALTDLRSMLGLLREVGRERDPLAPQPQLSDLPALVAQVRAAGLAVDLEVRGPVDVPAAVALSAYRIVQEALTNVLKHAGGVATRVCVEADEQLLKVDVTSDLRADLSAQRSPDGRGLLGMRERAVLHGGDVTCGPEGDRWRVHAVLPWRAP